MIACLAALVLAGITGCGIPQHLGVMNVCEMSRDFAKYRNRYVIVRGIYLQGLRQRCPQTCATGPWPSFVDIARNKAAGDAIWADLGRAVRTAQQAARQGRLFEVWVTVRGKLNTNTYTSLVGPCDQLAKRGYGYLSAFPAQIVADSFTDIRLIPATASPYELLRQQSRH